MTQNASRSKKQELEEVPVQQCHGHSAHDWVYCPTQESFTYMMNSSTCASEGWQLLPMFGINDHRAGIVTVQRSYSATKKSIRMIKVVWNVVKSIFGIVFMIFTPCKRLFCRRKRRTSDTILPLTNHYSIPQDFNQIPSGNQEELQSWDAWESEEKRNHSTNNSSHAHQGQRSRMQHDSTSEPEVDYFTDMAPEIKRQKKVYIGKKNDNSSYSGNRFAVSTDIPLSHGSELGVWEDTQSAWADEAAEDLSWQAEAAIKESRKSEHQKRLQEHQKRKMEKEGARGKKGQFSAVKLS